MSKPIESVISALGDQSSDTSAAAQPGYCPVDAGALSEVVVAETLPDQFDPSADGRTINNIVPQAPKSRDLVIRNDDEDKSVYNALVAAAKKTLDTVEAEIKLGGGNELVPLSTRIIQDARVVYFPNVPVENDLLASIMLEVVRVCENVEVVFIKCDKYEPITFTAEEKLLLSSIRRFIGADVPPNNLTSGSSREQRLYCYLWISAIKLAVSVPKPENWKPAYEFSLPTLLPVGNESKTPREATGILIASLARSKPQAWAGGAVKALHELLRNFMASQYCREKSYSWMRHQRIQWTSILRNIVPTKINKVKDPRTRRQIDQTIWLYPSHPKTTAWATNEERAFLTAAFKEAWGQLENIKTAWLAAMPYKQHDNYVDTRNAVRNVIRKQKEISTFSMKRLGHRKNVILKHMPKMCGDGKKMKATNDFTGTEIAKAWKACFHHKVDDMTPGEKRLFWIVHAAHKSLTGKIHSEVLTQAFAKKDDESSIVIIKGEDPTDSKVDAKLRIATLQWLNNFKVKAADLIRVKDIPNEMVVEDFLKTFNRYQCLTGVDDDEEQDDE